MKSLSESSQQPSVAASREWSLCSDWLVETREPLTAAPGWSWTEKIREFSGQTDIILPSRAGAFKQRNQLLPLIVSQAWAGQ